MTQQQRFEASEASVAAARQFVGRAIDDASPEVRESATVMVSELATNALLHAASGFVLRIDRDDASVTVSVTDRGDGGVPRLRDPQSTDPHGRGLRIVDALADEWGVETTWDGGTTVWFRLTVTTAGADGSSGSAHEPVPSVPAGWDDRTAAPDLLVAMSHDPASDAVDPGDGPATVISQERQPSRRGASRRPRVPSGR
jgi:anti-sigma regulatory factor (Ser/Thr protein kinase)